jgi:hypothetical protein
VELRLSATSVSNAKFDYRVNDLDDLKSIRRYLKRQLAPTTDEPYIYVEPIEGEFIRPAVTVRLIRTGAPATSGVRRPSYDVEHALVVTSYGRDRAETIALSERTWRLFNEGDDSQGASYRIPLWDFTNGWRLTRWMRVQRASLAFGLDTTDEAGLWSRPIEMRVVAPRARESRRVPTLASVSFQFS